MSTTIDAQLPLEPAPATIPAKPAKAAKKDALATVPASTPAPVTVMTLIERGQQAGASIEQMAQLFDLKLRVDADEARKAFFVAMAKFKENPPQINKNRKVSFETKTAGTTSYSHATLDHCVDAIAPALSAVGIRHRWEPAQTEAGWIGVTCILSHDLGHSESTTLKAPLDSSGSKNAIQSIGSSNTYLQRYTLLAATGMAAAGTDDDGDSAGKKEQAGPSMPEEEFVEAVEKIKACEDTETLVKTFQAFYKDAEDIGDKDALRKFVDVKNARKAELKAAEKAGK
jgi:hypothetical protein